MTCCANYQKCPKSRFCTLWLRPLTAQQQRVYYPFWVAFQPKLSFPTGFLCKKLVYTLVLRCTPRVKNYCLILHCYLFCFGNECQCLFFFGFLYFSYLFFLQILKPSEKKAKYQYSGLNSGRPVTPPKDNANKKK